MIRAVGVSASMVCRHAVAAEIDAEATVGKYVLLINTYPDEIIRAGVDTNARAVVVGNCVVADGIGGRVPADTHAVAEVAQCLAPEVHSDQASRYVVVHC